MSDLNQFLSKEEKVAEEKPPKSLKKEPKIINRRGAPLQLKDLRKTQIIELLDPLMTRVPGFASNLAWTHQRILPSNPNVRPEELASELGISLLEAYVILEKLQTTSK